MKKLNIAYVLIGLLIVCSVVGIGSGIYYYKQSKSAEQLLKNPDVVAKKETKEVVDKVKKLVMLPDEEPQMATVLDVEKLKDQPFFSQAKNGDKILVYTKAQKAVIYRPSTNMIVEVAPMNMNASDSAVPVAK